MPDDFTLSDEEKQAILAHRRDSAPKRKATLRGTDAESGNEWELELTAEESARLAARTLGKLFATDDGDGKKDPKDDGKRPTPLKDYFGKKTAAGS